MLTNFCIIHRRKPRFFQEAGAPVWATCLRSLAFVKSPGEVVTEAHDEIYVGPKAYVFLLEIICGLHSPIVGETEVFGQFKNFVNHWLTHQPEHAGLAQKVLADAKALRSRHLSRLGNQSYGSWLRKNVRSDEVHILGGGHLVKEILPYLTKQGKKVTVHVRDPRKIDFHSGPVREIQNRQFTGGALIVAAPMTAAEIGAWLGANQPEQTFDLRDNSCTDKVIQATEQYGLKAIFKQIEENKTKLLPVVEKVRTEISALTTKICSQTLVRPQGWDDLCA